MSSINPANLWVLRSLDREVVLVLSGQFGPSGPVRDTATPQIAEAAAPGGGTPGAQWVRQGVRSKRFRSSFNATSFADDLRPRRRLLERLRERDPALGRAPLVALTWGDQEFRGFVSELVIQESGRWAATGLPKAIAFELELREVPMLGPDAGRVSTGFTTYVTLGSGETLESIAGRLYRNPLRGELIRRVNPELATRDEQAGDRVRVPEPEAAVVRGAVEPQSAGLLGDWRTVLDDLATTRGTTASPGTRYWQLPEVASGAWL